jgi:hypothetical protein
MNTVLAEMKRKDNYKLTENGDVTYKSSLSKVLDMFAMGGSYRNRSDADCILLFKNAFAEDRTLALKCLFYLRDIRGGGQGERRFFRVVFRWLCDNYSSIAIKNLANVAEYGRWDDLIYVAEGTPCEKAAFTLIKHQLALDVQCKTPSLLAKWMPSQNASSETTKRLGKKLARFLGRSDKEYRKMLSVLRERIKVVEKLMSANRWTEIQFDKIPSKAGMIYRNAFARRDILAERYKAFAKNTSTKVNAKALYPQEIAHQALGYNMKRASLDKPERLMLQKYWDNLPNYYGNRQENGIAIVDTSGSMCGVPLEAAVSLGAYIADKARGPFANHFITFSATPRLVKFEGVDIVDKFNRCIDAEWGMNTNIQAVFDLLLKTAKSKGVKAEDMPTRLYIFSDMEFDRCTTFVPVRSMWDITSRGEMESGLERIKKQWELEGYKLPQVIFWNLDARQNNIPAIGEGFSYVSGFSPSMIECILGGKDGYILMIEKLMSKRYEAIKA